MLTVFKIVSLFLFNFLFTFRKLLPLKIFSVRIGSGLVFLPSYLYIIIKKYCTIFSSYSSISLNKKRKCSSCCFGGKSFQWKQVVTGLNEEYYVLRKKRREIVPFDCININKTQKQTKERAKGRERERGI